MRISDWSSDVCSSDLIAALIALGICERFDLRNIPVDSVQSQHIQIEAMKLAFADLYRYVSDPRSMQLTPEQMLDDNYLDSRAKLIRLEIGRASCRERVCQYV